jgi:hypothetical protein
MESCFTALANPCRVVQSWLFAEARAQSFWRSALFRPLRELDQEFLKASAVVGEPGYVWGFSRDWEI